MILQLFNNINKPYLFYRVIFEACQGDNLLVREIDYNEALK